MGGYVQSFKQRFPDKITPEMEKAFHGGKSKITEFKLEHIEESEDEFPGIMFFSKENVARKEGPYVTEAQIKMSRTVSPQSPPKRDDIVYMVTSAPQKDESLRKYDDNLREAYFKAIDYIMKGHNAKECFHRVCTEFYKEHNKEFVENMVKCNYDGAIIGGKDPYYIVFNPKTIQIITQ